MPRGIPGSGPRGGERVGKKKRGQRAASTGSTTATFGRYRLVTMKGPGGLKTNAIERTERRIIGTVRDRTEGRSIIEKLNQR